MIRQGRPRSYRLAALIGLLLALGGTAVLLAASFDLATENQ